MTMQISVSRLKLFKACRQAYRFKYIEGLEPVQKSDALVTGTNYHSKIEEIYRQGYCTVEDFSKECAMALAYEKYIYPKFKMTSVEDWFEYDVGNGYTLIGRTDGIAEDGHLVEHKTTSMNITEEYEYELQWDEQVLAYMLAKNTRKMWYTVIKKPTIRCKANESEEDFFNRMCKWYEDDTESKARVFEIERTDEEVEEFRQSFIRLGDMMRNAETSPERLIYRNPLHCHCWGRRCEYSSICLNYDPNQEYVEFKRRDNYYGDQKAG